MGRTYLFECTKCGYRAKVAGGVERGLHVAVQTIHCLECRELVDVVTELKVPATFAGNPTPGKLKSNQPEAEATPPRFPAALNRLVLGTGKRYRWQRFQPVCPAAARHRTRVWKQPGKCPKCGVFLEGGAIPFQLWD